MQALDLHGILIVGRRCPGCGAIHEYHLTSDISDPDEVLEILEDMADGLHDDRDSMLRVSLGEPAS